MSHQWGDEADAIVEAMDMCPVDCIYFVSRAQDTGVAVSTTLKVYKLSGNQQEVSIWSIIASQECYLLLFVAGKEETAGPFRVCNEIL